MERHTAAALLEKQEAGMPAEGDTAPPEYHWTVDAFTKAGEAGVLEDDVRLELIQGRIWEMMGQGPRHSTLASMIAEMLREAARRRFAVREEKPVRVAADSQPIPGILVFRGRQADYNDHQPEPDEVEILVEVSGTTIDDDSGDKALLYSQAGIRDYWAVVEKENAIVVHRQPSPDGYQSVTRLSGEDRLSALAMPEAVWAVDALLGRADVSEGG